MRKYRRAMVALSADPITFGHLELIRRATTMSHEVLVLIADNPKKKGAYLYSLNERVAMAARAVNEAAEMRAPVRVIGSPGLIVDIWLRENCDALVRVRNRADLDFEEEQAKINAMILPALEGCIEFIEPPDPRLRLVSSTMVKTFVEHRLDVDRFVPMFVKQSLEERLIGQYRVAVTGSIAVGKSFVAKQLVKVAQSWGHRKAHHVNVDVLIRELYGEESAGGQAVREALAIRFGDCVLAEGRKNVDRRKLAERIFQPQAFKDREFVTALTMPHVQRLYREDLADQQGLVVVEWAQLAEMDMGAWTNHNVIVVDSPDRLKFMAERDLDPERTALLAGLQLPAGEKFARLELARIAAGSGHTFMYSNLRREDPAAVFKDVSDLFSRVRASCFPDFGAR